jgi:hypothetical protein
MDALQVKREFLEITKELAHKCHVPEVRERLIKLADTYNRAIEKLELEAATTPREPHSIAQFKSAREIRASSQTDMVSPLKIGAP